MPLDSTGYTPIATHAQFASATGKQRLAYLAEALRQHMPEKFIWDFGMICDIGNECGTVGCALGLAHVLWPKTVQAPDHDEKMERIFEISNRTLYRIFYTPHTHIPDACYSEIFPIHVAATIEKYLQETP